jgi:hypothetical protein
MTIDLTQIILAIITLIFGVLMRYVIPSAKEHMNKQQLELLQIAVKTGVYAAEQLYNSDQGKEKREYVINFLKDHGYIVDPEKIEDPVRAMIEAAVRELKIEQSAIAEA